jgi:membrane associated rhomboid family serine protease
MGWQDRDYARATPRRVWAGAAGGPWLIGGSIVTTLIAVNVAVFLVASLFPGVGRLLSGYTAGSFLGVTHHPGIAELIAGRVARGEVWRLFSAQYLHAGMGHLFVNMLVLHFMGRPIERLWSPRKFFIIYTLCGLLGNAFYTALMISLSQNVPIGAISPAMIPAVGASGCIYGLLGIVAVLFPHATVYLWFLFPMNIRTLAFIFGGIAFLTVLQRGHNFGGEACHLAGMVFGVWWALKGDAWWSRIRGRAPAVRVSPTPRARSGWFRSSTGSGFADKIAERRADEQEIDRILRKVYDNGVMSLSEAEKRILQDATERQRQREEEAGRVDRL